MTEHGLGFYRVAVQEDSQHNSGFWVEGFGFRVLSYCMEKHREKNTEQQQLGLSRGL